jgi:hypothetical protein
MCYETITGKKQNWEPKAPCVSSFIDAYPTGCEVCVHDISKIDKSYFFRQYKFTQEATTPLKRPDGVPDWDGQMPIDVKWKIEPVTNWMKRIPDEQASTVDAYVPRPLDSAGVSLLTLEGSK